MFFIRRVADDFESILIVENCFTIFHSNFISTLVMRFTIDEEVAILIIDAMLTVYYLHLLTL